MKNSINRKLIFTVGSGQCRRKRRFLNVPSFPHENEGITKLSTYVLEQHHIDRYGGMKLELLRV